MRNFVSAAEGKNSDLGDCAINTIYILCQT
jgi:hypothetical protein